MTGTQAPGDIVSRISAAKSRGGLSPSDASPLVDPVPGPAGKTGLPSTGPVTAPSPAFSAKNLQPLRATPGASAPPYGRSTPDRAAAPDQGQAPGAAGFRHC